jgi:RND family efflux transporter MFP subunit
MILTNNDTGMKLLSIIFCTGILLAGCRNPETAAKPKETIVSVDSVKVFIVTEDSAKKTVVLPGELLPFELAQVRARMQGYIRTLKADIGSRVQKDQVLALIDAPEVGTRLDELSEKAKAASARYRASKDAYERINRASKSEGVIAPLELERTKNQLLADSAELIAAQLAAKSYRQMGDYLAVVAPYSGTITKRNVVVGSLVGSNTDMPLFELENDATIRLQVAVPELYTNAILLNNTGELTTRSLPDKKFSAKLIRKSNSIDRNSRSEIWEFEIPNPKGELKSGSYADVRLNFVRQGKSLISPVSAIVTTQEKKFVIRIVNNITQWVDVRTGFNVGDKQEIFGDVHPGDTIVLKATEELKTGTKVIPSLIK